MFKDGWLTVIGVGPGSGEYVTPAARRAAAAAEVLIGGRKALDLFADLECEKMLITGDLERLRDFLLKIRGRPTAVLVSGDPGLFSLLPWVKRQFPGEKINVIPGISSIQLAFARLACGWEDVVFLSCHGRSLEVLEPYLPRLKSAQVRLAILTGGANTPPVIGRYLVDHGLEGLMVWVGIELGGDGEQTAWLTAAELSRSDFLGPGVVIAGCEPD